MPDHEVIVLGTGGVGSAAMFHLAARGVRVLGLDRFPPGHDRGSSHGRTRIIRQAYFEHPDYVPLLRRAYELWTELERRRGRTLLHRIGLLQIGPAEGPVLAGVRRSALEHNLDVEEFDTAELQNRFPMFRADRDWSGIYERQAGYLEVEDCVRAHIDAAVAAGATLRTGVTVNGWRSEDTRVVVETDAGEFAAEKLVVAAGAWSPQMLRELAVPLVVRRKPQYWYPISDSRLRTDQGCPAFLFDTADGVFYGLPALDDLVRPWQLKVAEHTGGRLLDDPLLNGTEIDVADIARVEGFLSAHMPGVDRQLAGHAPCMYTLTPDEHFIVDRHPRDPRIVFAAGLSGHGFKFTCVLGEALADLTCDGATKLPIGFLSLNRFQTAL
jgi:monomeric sarcosine oxidase